MIIDTHCHLDFDEFAPRLNDIVQRAQKAGVERMITISTKVKEFQKVLAIAEKFDTIYCSVGTHPNNAHEEQEVKTDDIIKLTSHAKVVAIGEAGLDYHYDAPPHAQIKSFRNHIDAARATGLPLVIHARNADDDVEKILREEMQKGAFPFILHCYSSGMALAKAGIELGGYLSFSGILTFKNAAEIREIAKIIPRDRLLVETDAPFLAPVPYRGQTNEPSFVIKTAEILAKTIAMPFEELAKQTTENAFRIFSKMS